MHHVLPLDPQPENTVTTACTYGSITDVMWIEVNLFCVNNTRKKKALPQTAYQRNRKFGHKTVNGKGITARALGKRK